MNKKRVIGMGANDGLFTLLEKDVSMVIYIDFSNTLFNIMSYKL